MIANIKLKPSHAILNLKQFMIKLIKVLAK